MRQFMLAPAVVLTALLSAPAPAQTAPPSAAALRDELVQQVLGGWNGQVTPVLRPGALPPTFPITLPGSAAVRLVGSLERLSPVPEQGDQTVVFAGNSAAALDQYLGSALRKAGFAPQTVLGLGQQGAFVAAGATLQAPRLYTRLDAPDATAGVRATVLPSTTGGRSYAQLVLQRAPDLARELRFRASGPGQEPYAGLPVLRAPEGVSVFETGGGGGSSNYSMNARLQGQTSAAQLIAFYTPQLRAAGWTAAGQVTAGGALLTYWTFKDGGQERFGLLGVRETGPGVFSALLSTSAF